MALTLFKRTTPFENPANWYEEFENCFNDTLITDNLKTSWYPAVDIEHKENEYVLTADLPGLKKEDINIVLENNYLTLKGERKTENDEKNKNFHRLERTYGTFERSFKVPEGLTEKDVKAKYHNGVLELTIPTPKTEKPKSINVKID